MKITDMRIGMRVRFKAKGVKDRNNVAMDKTYQVTALQRSVFRSFTGRTIIDWVSIETRRFKWMREFEAKLFEKAV